MENRYEHLSVAELERESNLYVHRYRNNGGRSEFDLATNDISRALIAAFRRERGWCLLGRFHPPKTDENDPACGFTPYVDQPIRNFEYDFIVAAEDEELRRMIADCNRRDGRPASIRPGEIVDRIETLGGCLLWWS